MLLASGLLGFSFVLVVIWFVGARYVALRACGVRDLRLAACVAPKWAHPSAPRATRLAVIAAGVVGGYLAASSLALVGFREGGVTVVDTTSLRVDVAPGGAADDAGLTTGDRVLAVAGAPVASWDAIKASVRAHAGSPIAVEVARGSETRTFSVTPPQDGPRAGRISIAPYTEVRTPAPFESLGMALAMPGTVVWEVGKGFARIARGTEAAQLAGPVGIVRETATATSEGIGPGCKLAAGLVAYGLWFVLLVSVIGTPRRTRGGAI